MNMSTFCRIGLLFRVRLLNFEEACRTSRAAIDTALTWSISDHSARELGGAGVWKTTHGWRHQGPSHIHAVTK